MTYSVKDAVSKAQAGDNAAFEFLAHKYTSYIRRQCLRWRVPSCDIDDMVQKILIRIWTKLPQFKGNSLFTTWMFRIVQSELGRYFRHARTRVNGGGMRFIPFSLPHYLRENGESDKNADDLVPRADHVLETMPLHLDLKRAVNRLAPVQKRAFIMHDIIGLTHKEIAAQRGITEGASKSNLEGAHTRLKKLLCVPVSQCA